MKKLKRFFIALLLLPACYGVTKALWSMLQPFRHVPEGSFYFFIGMASYVAFQWVFFRPIRTYVFGHELSHALAAWASGAKVRHFRVSKKGGSVSVNRSNVFIALAPYVLPLYSIAVMLAYFIGCALYAPLKGYWHVFLWILGASFAFHMALTAYALQMDQPDLRLAGKFLSGVVIYLGNVVSVVMLLGVLFPKTVSWTRFAHESRAGTWDAVKNVGKGTQVVLEEAVRVAQK